MAAGSDTSDNLTFTQPYFQRPEPMTWEKQNSYIKADVGTAGCPVITHTVSHQWNHGVGEILTALLEAGLVLDEVTETRFSAWCRWPDLMERCDQGWQLRDPALRDLLPLQLAVTAHLPGQV